MPVSSARWPNAVMIGKLMDRAMRLEAPTGAGDERSEMAAACVGAVATLIHGHGGAMRLLASVFAGIAPMCFEAST